MSEGEFQQRLAYAERLGRTARRQGEGRHCNPTPQPVPSERYSPAWRLWGAWLWGWDAEDRRG